MGKDYVKYLLLLLTFVKRYRFQMMRSWIITLHNRLYQPLFYIGLAVLVFLPLTLSAAPEQLNSGDTAWMLIATALVAMMTPAGLALFYGGMTPSRNVINTVGMSYMSYCIGSVIWITIAYTLSFGTSISIGDIGIIGSVDNLFLQNIKPGDLYGGNIPLLMFVAYQGTFAAIAVALISGSIIERVKFSAWIVFTILWSIIVYSPVAHWVWGGGFMTKMGVLDFAGGTVIHITAGISGLVLAILVGPRLIIEGTEGGPYSIKFTVLGAALLWFGWFGFNGGSALAANGIAVNALMATNIAASLGVVGWMLIEWLFTGRYTMFGAASGTVAGLVAITPGAGYVSTTSAIVIGLLGGVIGYFGVYELKKRTKVDDSLDAFGVHALAGCWGILATGIFADPEINPAGKGVWYGNPDQIIIQIWSILITVVYSAIGTIAVFYITKFLTRGFRVDEATERAGIDSSFHGESA